MTLVRTSFRRKAFSASKKRSKRLEECTMKYSHFFFHGVSILSLLFVIVACSQTASSPSVATPSVSLSPTAPSPSPTSTPTLLPTIAASPLGTVPQNCSPGPTPRSIFGGLGPVVGKAPVWAAGFAGPHAMIPIPTSNDTHTQHGWIWKILWDVGPLFPHQITIRGKNMHTGTPLEFQFFDPDPVVTSLLLDPNHPNHFSGAAGPDYKEWGSYLYIPTAGCYQLEATWPGGQWSFPFAAGRQ